MAKINALFKLIKLIGKGLLFVIRLLLVVIPKVAGEIRTVISKRLRFSITFKAGIAYTFIFMAIYTFLSASIIGAFVSFLYYDAQLTLEKKVKVTTNFIQQGLDSAQDTLSNYAKSEEIEIYLLNSERALIYSTTEETPPLLATSNRGLSLINEKVYYHAQIPLSNQVQFVVIDRVLDKEALSILLLVGGLTLSFFFCTLFITSKGSKALRRMLQPIDDMIRTTRVISAHDLNTRLNVVNSHDELKELAETFNEMLDRIEASYEKQNRFVSDASHELRTPIAVIQGYANLLKRWGKEDKEVLEEAMTAIQNESENMQILVERLLFLARADRETQKLDKTAFNLNGLMEEVVRDTQLIDSDHLITGNFATPISLIADRGLLKQALRVFIENSIKFTPPGGEIKITSMVEGGYVSIVVQDSGIGIPSEDLPHVFNRFYKSDKSRTRGKGGTGLGLSIAKWIIDKHQGSISVESVVGVGTKVKLKLPL